MNVLQRIVLLAAFFGLPSQADELTLYQESVVGEVLLDATGYCAYKAEGYNSPEARNTMVEEGFASNLLINDRRFIILDSDKLDCGVGDSGSCGSAGCTIWIIGPTEQKLLLGKLVQVPEGFDEEGPRILYCGNDVSDWEGCVDVRTLLE